MSTLATNAITDAAGGNTATINSYTPTESNMAGRNRIINGDMRIDQRNAGAAVTVSSSYPVDRFFGQNINSNSAVVTAQQSTTVPTGFKNSVVVTVTTGGAVAASDRTFLSQLIEGYNVADLGFGTANASTVTLSFWVRSSVTGTFGGSLSNSAVNRAYPFTYTINSANTYEYKSVTIAGDTSGTWVTDNGVGLRVYFGLGVGTNRQGTAGVWGSADYRSATGATSIVTTTGATFYLTGVQLEAGSVATPFERRQYGQELALCQRYYENIVLLDVSGYVNPSKQAYSNIQLIPKRATPSVTALSSNTNSDNFFSYEVSFGTNDFQHMALRINAANGGVNYVRTTFNNLTFNSEL